MKRILMLTAACLSVLALPGCCWWRCRTKCNTNGNNVCEKRECSPCKRVAPKESCAPECVDTKVSYEYKPCTICKTVEVPGQCRQRVVTKTFRSKHCDGPCQEICDLQCVPSSGKGGAVKTLGAEEVEFID